MLWGIAVVVVEAELVSDASNALADTSYGEQVLQPRLLRR
jgi:hypothetical protein